MDPSNLTLNKSPRRELQGPRPTPLKVHKESHKIKKPPLAPQTRQPVIIYDVSPEVIHTNPSDFMALVQRLTGSSSSSCSSSVPSSTTTPFNQDGGEISPAARYATVEKANTSPEGKKKQLAVEKVGVVEGIEIGHGVERTTLFPGILSPGPTSLPPISPNFFWPALSTDPNSFSFLQDLISPVINGSKNFIEGSFIPSPSSFVSPTPSIDLFNNFFDN
ncbi:hypothetical protein SLA2020_068600 [Shorea laevis]